MFKKIKDLTLNDINNICDKNISKCDKCVLYNTELDCVKIMQILDVLKGNNPELFDQEVIICD